MWPVYLTLGTVLVLGALVLVVIVMAEGKNL